MRDRDGSGPRSPPYPLEQRAKSDESSGGKRIGGPYLYVRHPHWVGDGGSPKSSQMEQDQLMSVRDNGRGVQNTENLADVI